MSASSPPIHASAAVVGEAGVLIRGDAGSGKSSLVLRLLALDPRTTWLVADDYVVVAPHAGRLVASAPPAIAGRMEIRGQGIVERPYVSPVVIRLVVDLMRADDCPRLPEADAMLATIEGIALARMIVPVGSFDGAERVRQALADHGGMP